MQSSETEQASSTPPDKDGRISPTREQVLFFYIKFGYKIIKQQLCLTACAPSDAHLSELDEDDDELLVNHRFPYSSGSSPVSSFRMAIHQSRAPSNCGKFNESLLGGLTDSERIKSTLCVCCSIRPRAQTGLGIAEEEKDDEEAVKPERFPTKNRPVTDEYKISHEVFKIVFL